MRASILSLSLIAVSACGDAVAPAADARAGIDATTSCVASAGWSAAPSVLGGPIQETAAVAVDGKVYVIGGFNASLGVVPNVRIFDTATCTWSDGPDLPRPVHHANAAAVDGTIYVLGAMQGLNFIASGEVWAWKPATESTWSTRATMPSGTERGSAIVGVVDGLVYLAGGLRGGAVAEVSAYDPSANAWDTSLPALPEARDHGCGGVVDGKLYVTGGRMATIESTSDAVFEYTPGGTWADRAPMPTGRGGTACGVIDDRIFVVGGEGNPDTTTHVFPDVEAYTPATNTWEQLSPMVTPRHGMGAAAWGRALFVPGGATQDGFGAVDTTELLRP
jgi:N-acetylneuraminic acid mutarotase